MSEQSTTVLVVQDTEQEPRAPGCPHGELPTDRRSFERWLRAHGLAKRLAVKLAAAWPITAEEEAEDLAILESLKNLLSQLRNE